MQGKLITFEGVEGSGKTTQITRTQCWLESSGWLSKLTQCFPELTQPLLVTREPGGTQLGLALRQVLLHPSFEASEPLADRTELLLYAADRAQHVDSLLKPHLAQGTLILCDRYTDSTVAYQGYGRGLSLDLIDQLNQIATGGLTGDLTFWLDLDAEAGLARAQQRSQNQATGALDRIEAVDLSFHQQIQQGFQALAQQYPERIVRIDAAQAETLVARQIQAVLAQRLSQWYTPISPD